MKPKLTLFDVFSYSCMNCLRSLDFIKKIDNKYKKFGLETIIIHPPEWEFEKNKNNIRLASKKYSINFPIKIDSNYKIIKKFNISFWPAQILINGKKVIYRHIGEGSYKELENFIIKNLNIKSKKLFNNEPLYTKFPTIYCGKRKHGKIKLLDNRNKLKFGIIYLNRSWIQKKEYIQSLKNNSSLTIVTEGKIINFVAKALNNKVVKVKITLNNKIINNLSIKNPQLYQIIKLKNDKETKLTLITDKNTAIFSFSFQ